jgi:hypothetical protein
LQRWPLGTPYTQIVADVADRFSVPPLNAGVALAVDQTGVGRAVVDMFRQSPALSRLEAILITAGHATSRGDDGSWHVPKKELVSVLQVLLQARRLRVAKLPERETLVKEFLTFRIKMTAAGNETFEAWRERDHDDLVLAVALAAWLGERGSRVRVPVTAGQLVTGVAQLRLGAPGSAGGVDYRHMRHMGMVPRRNG